MRTAHTQIIRRDGGGGECLTEGPGRHWNIRTHPVREQGVGEDQDVSIVIVALTETRQKYMHLLTQL